MEHAEHEKQLSEANLRNKLDHKKQEQEERRREKQAKFEANNNEVDPLILED